MTEIDAHSYKPLVSKVVLVQILFIFGNISSANQVDIPCGQLTNPPRNTSDQKIFPPWSAIIKKEYDSTRNQLKIAGVIVAPNLIMSSAFYFVSNSTIMTISPYKYFEVTVGTHVWVPGVAGGEVKKFKISHISLHPKYSIGTFWSNTRNDQILFHLAEPVNISELVQPICLPTNQQIMDLILVPGGENPPPIITGWTQNYPDEFYLYLDLKSKSECIKRWKDLDIPDVYQNRFCATVSEDNNQTQCVRRDVATMRRWIDDKFYLAGQMNQLFSHNFTCTPGSLYFFNMFNMETFSWIRDTIRCGPSNFTCGTGKCIPLYKQCNRYRECPDGSDEVIEFCKYLYKCLQGEFYCGASEDDICIPDEKVNDGVKDCPNGEDEFDLVLTPGKIMFGTILALLTLVVGGYVLQKEIRKERRYTKLRDEEEAFNRRQRLASSPWKSDPSLVHIRQIGEGSFPTTVHEAHDLNQAPYAVKCVSIPHTLQHNQENLPSTSSAPVEAVIIAAVNLLLNEIEVLTKLSEISCDQLVRYYGCWAELEGSAQVVSRAELQAYVGQSVTGVLPTFTTSNTPLSHIFIKMELCDFTLQRYLYPEINQPVINQNQDIIQIAKSIISGLAYIHERQYVHADIKPGNVFCKALSSENRYTWKIGDFGLAAKMMPEGIEGPVGTKTYRSPEMIVGQRYSDKTDVYSLGLVFVELVQQHGSMFGRVDTFDAIRNCRDDEERLRYIGGEVAIGSYSRFVEVINTMLRENPDERPSSEELKWMEF